MRLIDLDETLRQMHMDEVRYDYDSYYGYTEAIKFVSKQPAVNAIPVDWITNWAKKFYEVIKGRKYYMGDGYDTVWDLLEDWERANQYGKD